MPWVSDNIVDRLGCFAGHEEIVRAINHLVKAGPSRAHYGSGGQDAGGLRLPRRTRDGQDQQYREQQ